MPSSSPLTARERNLRFEVVGALLMMMAIPVVSFGADRAIAIPVKILEWLHGEWLRMLAGRMPRLTISNIVSALFTCTTLGILSILPPHVAHLLRCRRCPPVQGLWFWTMI